MNNRNKSVVYSSFLPSSINTNFIYVELYLHILYKYIFLSSSHLISLPLFLTNSSSSSSNTNSNNEIISDKEILNNNKKEKEGNEEKEENEEQGEDPSISQIDQKTEKNVEVTTKKKKEEIISKNVILSSVSTKIRAIKISAGWHHVGVISSDFQLYMFGNDRKGQLGLSEGKLSPSPQYMEKGEELKKYYTSPTLVTYFVGKKIIEIECGGEFTFTLDSDKNCFSWGSNSHGQCLLDSVAPYFSSPQPISLSSSSSSSSSSNLSLTSLSSTIISKIKKISLGDFHSFLILEDNSLYCGGLGENGQLGLGPLQNPEVKSPKKLVITGHTIDSISCGSCHTLFLTIMGSVLVCGMSGEGGNNEKVFTPHLVKEGNLVGKRIIEICADGCKSHVLTDLGSIYSWEIPESSPKPKLFESLVGAKIGKVRGGYWMNFAFFPSSFSFYTWPSSSSGNLDSKTSKSEKIEVKVMKIEEKREKGEGSTGIEEIVVGEEFCIILMKTGELYTYGNNKYGVTGISKEDGFLSAPILLPFTLDISHKFSSSNPKDIKNSDTEYNSNSTNNSVSNSIGMNKKESLIEIKDLENRREGKGEEDQTIENKEDEKNKFLFHPQIFQHLKSENQKELENILISNFSKYRAFNMLQLSFLFQNWQAASIIYKLLRKWKLYLSTKLLHISSQFLFFPKLYQQQH
eukprot:TRINITY_DN3493_c0_g2_i1.p1 TRINITY_DN3493_c0_g2~~TRINITY_DN3493_c0_g2_i1.p1  ORF type:complete len:744 (-),score=244.57 TRINITY_DN3493_c0_g2_i1:782-2842(-)